MKLSLIIVLLFSVSQFLYAQEEETLLDIKTMESGGYGAVSVKMTSLKNEPAVWVGGSGGWIINHTFVLGGGGYGLVSRIKADDEAQIIDGKKFYIQAGYGGFVMEYINRSKKLLHYTVDLLIGGGGAGYVLKDDYSVNENKTASFFVMEPGINAELNVVEYFRIELGASYRFVSGLKMTGLSNSDLSGFNGVLTLKFGKF